MSIPEKISHKPKITVSRIDDMNLLNNCPLKVKDMANIDPSKITGKKNVDLSIYIDASEFNTQITP